MDTPLTAPVVGVGAVVWKDGRLLLIRRGQPPRQGSWSLPGGRQELGETVQQTAVREVLEETGVTIRILDLAAVVDLIHHEGAVLQYHYTVIDFVAEWTGGEAVAGDDAAAVRWVTPAELDGYDLTPEMHRVIAIAADKLRGA